MTETNGRVIAAATDGACSGNPGPGGWGALIRFENGTVEEFGGHAAKTTNNRMELKAALAILLKLKDLPRHPNLTIRTDSKYLINGLTQWMKGWKSKGWRTSAGKPVLNKDLWEALDKARLDDVALEYVKGHSGDPDNERVDEIAVSFSKGTYITLNSQKDLVPKGITSSHPKIDSEKSNHMAPPELQRLLSRLEIANYFAKNGYHLTLVELAQLIDEPIEKLEKQVKSWQWRNWVIEPIGDGKWKLRSINKDFKQLEENSNG